MNRTATAALLARPPSSSSPPSAPPACWRIGLHFGMAGAAEPAVVIPAPAVDEPAAGRHTETAVFAGGCFWGVQGVFQHVKGVTNAVSGYSGGDEATPRTTRPSATATRATPNRCRSRSTRRR